MKRPEITEGEWWANGELIESHDYYVAKTIEGSGMEEATAKAIATLPALLDALEAVFPILMSSDQSATDKGMENSKRIAALRGVMIRAGYTF